MFAVPNRDLQNHCLVLCKNDTVAMNFHIFSRTYIETISPFISATLSCHHWICWCISLFL